MKYYIHTGCWVYNDYKDKGEAQKVYDVMKEHNDSLYLDECPDDHILYPYYAGAFNQAGLKNKLEL